MNNDRTYYSHDAEIRAMRDRTLLTLLFLMFGLALGAAMALLFAPATGKQTRVDLAKNIGEGLNNGREALEPMVKRLEEELRELRKNVEEHLSMASSGAVKQE
jgi:gas vesicle protein